MINSKLSSIPAKYPLNFGARPHKIPNCKKSRSFKNLKLFHKIVPLSYHIVSSCQGDNANKALFIDFDRRTLINQN